MAYQTRKTGLSEDWIAVLLGGATLMLVLAGVRPGLPAFAWAAMPDLAGRILTAPNLLRALALLAGIGGLAVAGIALMRGSPARFLVGLPVVFALACVRALRSPASRVFVTSGIEYVIFALLLGLADQQHDRRAGGAQARGADRVLHQDRPGHPRRQPAVP